MSSVFSSTIENQRPRVTAATLWKKLKNSTHICDLQLENSGGVRTVLMTKFAWDQAQAWRAYVLIQLHDTSFRFCLCVCAWVLSLSVPQLLHSCSVSHEWQRCSGALSFHFIWRWKYTVGGSLKCQSDFLKSEREIQRSHTRSQFIITAEGLKSNHSSVLTQDLKLYHCI